MINHNFINLFEILNSSINQNENKYILFYSGHGKNGNMILPNDDEINFNDLIQFLSMSIKQKSQILFVIDCCSIGKLNLTFKYNDGWYEYQSKNYYEHNILTFTSSHKEKSISTNYGSLFTKHFLKNLNLYHFNDIITNIDDGIISDSLNIKNKIEIPKISIYSSYIFLDMLWPWLVNSKFELLTDQYLRHVKITKL